MTFTDPGDLGTAITPASLTIIQVSEDPENTLDGTSYVVPDLYAIDLGIDGYVMKVTFNNADDTISVASKVEIPTEYKISLTPEHFDVGRQHFVVLSPIDCSATYNVDSVDPSIITDGVAITNASARTYTFSPVNGPVDGWSCDDLPASDTTTSAWDLTGTRRRLLEGGDFHDILSSNQMPF